MTRTPVVRLVNVKIYSTGGNYSEALKQELAFFADCNGNIIPDVRVFLIDTIIDAKALIQLLTAYKETDVVYIQNKDIDVSVCKYIEHNCKNVVYSEYELMDIIISLKKVTWTAILNDYLSQFPNYTFDSLLAEIPTSLLQSADMSAHMLCCKRLFKDVMDNSIY